MPTLFPGPFAPEPAHRHGQAEKVGILYCNLGTPDAPSTAAVRRYLAEFLSDHRVVELPRWLWWPVLHGIILRLRPAKSAAKYASIWTAQGSPLLLWTVQQAQALQTALQAQHPQVLVLPAMRYGQPGIAAQLDALKAQGATRILVLSAYPQYSGTTSASVFDAVYAWAAKVRHVPELRFVNQYHDHPAYIAALADNIRAQWRQHGQAQRLLMSFHGVPQRTLTLGDPYHCQCLSTARLLAQALQLPEHAWGLSFQSRLGRAPWLQPYTEPTLKSWAQQGFEHVQVVCPGFTADCLETLEEIAMEGRQAFLSAGGKRFEYLTALNAQPAWISALAQISSAHLGSWPSGEADGQALAQQRQRALQCGAMQ